MLHDSKSKMLGIMLDRKAGGNGAGGGASAGGASHKTSDGKFDRSGYMTSLKTAQSEIRSHNDIADIRKARVLYDSIRKTNPGNAPAWIASARLEEHDGKLVKARVLMRQGCKACPGSEDAWLENARLQANPKDRRLVLAEAVRHVPRSVKVWMKCIDAEDDTAEGSSGDSSNGAGAGDSSKSSNAPARVRQRLVCRRALQLVPESVALWRRCVELEDDNEDARVMLRRAIECVPPPVSADFRLALARLETYENAQKVLNDAIKALPKQAKLYVAGAQLLEGRMQVDENAADEAAAAGDAAGVAAAKKKIAKSQKRLRKIMAMAAKKVGTALGREEWFDEAKAAEEAGTPLCAAAVALEAMKMGVEELDRKRTWSEDAKALAAHGAANAARAVL